MRFINNDDDDDGTNPLYCLKYKKNNWKGGSKKRDSRLTSAAVSQSVREREKDKL